MSDFQGVQKGRGVGKGILRDKHNVFGSEDLSVSLRAAQYMLPGNSFILFLILFLTV